MKVQVELKKIELKIEVDPTIKTKGLNRIYTDERRLKQVLFNLISFLFSNLNKYSYFRQLFKIYS